MKKKFICLMLISACLFCTPTFASASARNIYVGDIITLNIASQDLSAEELEEYFKDFEIVDMKFENGEYSVSLRTFEVGTYGISIGNARMELSVNSTLDEIEQEEIFEGETTIEVPGFPFHWRIVFCVSAVIFAFSGGFVLFGLIKKRKGQSIHPYSLFLRRSEALLSKIDNNNFFVYLTFFFKDYVGKLYQRRIIGKTSSEIVFELKEIQALGDMLPIIEKWLIECDRMKFTGIEVSSEEKQKHYALLLRLAELINKKEEKQEEVTT